MQKISGVSCVCSVMRTAIVFVCGVRFLSDHNDMYNQDSSVYVVIFIGIVRPICVTRR